MMDQAIKAEWLKDLRDGTRKQGNMRLRKGDGSQCCLDVLCEQAVRKGIIPPPEFDEEEYMFEYVDIYGGGDTEWLVLPESVRVWAGLESSDPVVPYNRKNGSPEASMSALNDSERLSFSEIADVIENAKDL